MLLRLATLAIALTAALSTSSGAQAQSDATTVDAQKIEGVSDLEVSARGQAEIRHGDVGVFGEFLRYNREFGELEGEGGVRLQSGVDRFFGPSLYYNLLDDTGTFQSPQFLLQRERLARGSADRIEFAGKSKYKLFGARFTTCKPGQDDWFLEAREIDLDYEADEGRADHPRRNTPTLVSHEKIDPMWEYRMPSTPAGKGDSRMSPSWVATRPARPWATMFARAFSHTVG